MSHTHITPEQRNEISVLLHSGILQKDIAKLLGKNSISRNSRNQKK